MSTLRTSTLTVTIDAPYAQVAKDLADPMTHPEWGREFFAGPAERTENGAVLVQIPAMGGEVRYQIEADIERGIFDIYLAPIDEPFGPPLPVRLLHNGDGVDVLWSLAQQPGMPEAIWQEGLASMERELKHFKRRHEQ